jgi:hypothetical protein
MIRRLLLLGLLSLVAPFLFMASAAGPTLAAPPSDAGSPPPAPRRRSQ